MVAWKAESILVNFSHSHSADVCCLSWGAPQTDRNHTERTLWTPQLEWHSWSIPGHSLEAETQWGTEPTGLLSTFCTLQTPLGLGSCFRFRRGLRLLRLQEGPPPSSQDSSGLYGGQTCLECRNAVSAQRTLLSYCPRHTVMGWRQGPFLSTQPGCSPGFLWVGMGARAPAEGVGTAESTVCSQGTAPPPLPCLRQDGFQPLDPLLS